MPHSDLVLDLNMFVAKYWSRLRLDPGALDGPPTYAKLCRIHEANLARIPFENLLQHGCNRNRMYGPAATLEISKTDSKILDRYRGGFCYEVNGLLGAFLSELGYNVKYVPATVHAGVGPTGFRDMATHIILIVCCPDAVSGDHSASNSGFCYYADVGFGEPPLHPLKYDVFGEEQVTPEGMKSRLTKVGDEVQLQWYHSESWHPRLKWSYEESLRGIQINDEQFEEGLKACQSPNHIYSQKIITTLLTRTTKVTLAGNRLKITGPPRFQSDGSQGSKEISYLASEEDARRTLQEHFGMPLEETEGLSFEASRKAKESVWAQY